MQFTLFQPVAPYGRADGSKLGGPPCINRSSLRISNFLFYVLWNAVLYLKSSLLVYCFGPRLYRLLYGGRRALGWESSKTFLRWGVSFAVGRLRNLGLTNRDPPP